MRFFGSIFTALLSIFLFSCESVDTTISSNERSDNTIQSAQYSVFTTATCFGITQSVDGHLGGVISFDTTFVNCENDTVTMSFAMNILPGSYAGIKEIVILPDFTTCSIKFYPEIQFNKHVLLDLSYKGLDLENMGYTSNSKADFVFLSDDGNIEYLLSKECNVLFNQALIFVKKAQLIHFSRYSFIRKNL